MTAAAASEHGLRRRVAQEACAWHTRADRIRIWPSSPADARSMAAARVSHIGICGAGARLEVLCELSRSSPHRGGASVASRGRDSADALPRAVPVEPSRARATPAKVRCHTARTACAPVRRAAHAPRAVNSGARTHQRRAARPSLAGACGRRCTRRRACAGISRGICHAPKAHDGPAGLRVPRFWCSHGRAPALRQVLVHLSRSCVSPALAYARWGTS